MASELLPLAHDVEIRIGGTGYPVLDAFMADRSRVGVIRGPLGSGKTYGAIPKLMTLMCEQEPNAENIRPTRFVAIRNTYSDLTATTIKDFLEIFTKDFGEMKWSDPPTYRVSFDLTDGTHVRSEVIFLALDREDSVRKLRGYQVTGFWGNELKELVKAIWDMADLRHGRYPSPIAGGVEPTWHGMIGDTNAPDEDHWLYKLAEEDHPLEWKFFHQPGGVLRSGKKDANGREIWIPNPDAENLKNLPDGYYIKGMQGKSDEWISVNLANEYGFVSDGRPVHPEYIDSVHCPGVIEYDPELPIVLGIDFGRTPAAAICQRSPQWGRFVVIDEFVTQGMSQAVFGPALKRYLGSTYPGAAVRGWSDPAGEFGNGATEDTERRVLVAAGIPCQPAPSNSPILRRAAVANPLNRNDGGTPGLLVSSKAKMIRKGLAGGFCYRRLKVAGDERFTDQPDKNVYSHPVEALEYALLGEGEGTAALMPADYDDRDDYQITADGM